MATTTGAQVFTCEGADSPAGLLHQRAPSSQAILLLTGSPGKTHRAASGHPRSFLGHYFVPSKSGCIRTREADAKSATLGFVFLFQGLRIQFNTAFDFFTGEALVVRENVLH